MECHGFSPASSANSNCSAINGFSGGNLIVSKGTLYSFNGVIYRNGASLRNCYYLDGIQNNLGVSPETGAIKFVKTSDDPDAKTSEKVKDALNNFIELKGVIEEGDTEVDTTGWCKWKIGDNNLPVLDFNTEWNGTTWVTLNN